MLIMLISIVKTDSASSLSNHVAHPIGSVIDQALIVMDCGVILLGDRKLWKLLMALKTLFYLFLATLLASRLMQLRREFSSMVSHSHVQWMANYIWFIKHLLNLIYTPCIVEYQVDTRDFHLTGIVCRKVTSILDLLTGFAFKKHVLHQTMDIHTCKVKWKAHAYAYIVLSYTSLARQ